MNMFKKVIIMLDIINFFCNFTIGKNKPTN